MLRSQNNAPTNWSTVSWVVSQGERRDQIGWQLHKEGRIEYDNTSPIVIFIFHMTMNMLMLG